MREGIVYDMVLAAGLVVVAVLVAIAVQATG